MLSASCPCAASLATYSRRRRRLSFCGPKALSPPSRTVVLFPPPRALALPIPLAPKTPLVRVAGGVQHCAAGSERDEG